MKGSGGNLAEFKRDLSCSALTIFDNEIVSDVSVLNEVEWVVLHEKLNSGVQVSGK